MRKYSRRNDAKTAFMISFGDEIAKTIKPSRLRKNPRKHRHHEELRQHLPR